MGEDKQLEVSRTVNAPAEQVFGLLADPKQHVVIDGSGMLQGSDSGPVTADGQVFAMTMHHKDLGDYRVLNTVTEYERNARIGWAPGLDPDCALAKQLAHIRTGGQTYTYRLRPAGDGTEVTQVYDWSGVTDPAFAEFCPFVTRDELAATLDRIAASVEPT
jgi:hypothetical protein